MDIDVYQKEAVTLAEYPDRGANMVYPALGLMGEAGEVAEKVKKLWRNHGTMSGAGLDEDRKLALVKELGDVLWYCAALSTEFGVNLSEVLEANLEKLYDRKSRGVIKSEGDNR